LRYVSHSVKIWLNFEFKMPKIPLWLYVWFSNHDILQIAVLGTQKRKNDRQHYLYYMRAEVAHKQYARERPYIKSSVLIITWYQTSMWNKTITNPLFMQVDCQVGFIVQIIN
jgi:hypothetical protein